MSVDEFVFQNIFEREFVVDQIVVIDEDAVQWMYIDDEAKMLRRSVNILDQ